MSRGFSDQGGDVWIKSTREESKGKFRFFGLGKSKERGNMEALWQVLSI